MDSIAKSAVNRLNQSNYQVDINSYQFEKANEDRQVELPHPGKFDVDYMLKFLDEVDSSVRQTHEFKSMVKEFKLAVSRFSKTMEKEYLNNLPIEKKNQIFRDVKFFLNQISRIYDQQDIAIELKDRVRKIITYKLEDIRRNLKDSKWNLCLNLLQLTLNKNRGNRDIFDLFQKRILPSDLRQLIWKHCLENKEMSDEYSKKLSKARGITMSRFEVQIIKDTEAILAEMIKPDVFDGTMIFAMKTILSYYELRQDRVLTDYLYMICIPLVYTFGPSKHMLKIPSDLIGYFYSLQMIVQMFDPLVDLVVKHDEKYDSEMTDLFMNSLNVLDEELGDKFAHVLNLSAASQRTQLVILIKRFVHSLGFAFLPLDVELFVLDQILMKVVRNRLEIFIDMAIMCFCIRDQLLAAKNWDQVVDVIYTQAKMIEISIFHQYYMDVFKNVKFYISPYDVDPQQVNRNAQLGADPLADLMQQQQKNDIHLFKRKWFEGKDLHQDDDSRLNEPAPPPRETAIKQMTMQDALKNVQPLQTKKQGMVPLDQEDDESEDIFADMPDNDDEDDQ